jgi:elongation factor Ts
VASYVHNQEVPGLGKIGVLVAIESTGDKGVLEAFGRQLAMHIAATNPQSLDTDSLDQSLIEREREVLMEQARASGKPEEIIEKMVIGRLRKFYEEVVLLEQVFVIDGESRVSKAVEAAGREAGAPIKVIGFVRMQLGEGIEREESDFAAEVAAQLGN